ncbi:MAG: glycosyltransferase [Lentisphaeria bacterium]|nr:glycosyltransferase [Lentisphaeria bacterium]
MPIISVIVPIYKVEPYLPACLDSILAQSFTNFELILVNDGSPDNCGAISEAYAARDRRIQVIHKTNGGLSDARNAGLDRAKGDYISFIDSDDWVAPDFLESLLGALQRQKADIAVCNMLEAQPDSPPQKFYQPSTEEKLVEGDEIFDTLYQPCAQNKLYKSSIFSNLRFALGRWYEDVFIYTDILAQVKRLAYTGKDSYFYRIRPGSIMQNEYKLKCTDIIDALDLRARGLDKLQQPQHANMARLHLYSQLSVAFAELDSKKPENLQRLKEIKAIYDQHYPSLMQYPENCRKQKLRLWLLHKLPRLHNRIYTTKAIS